MRPRLFPYRTIIGRCWVGLLKLHRSQGCDMLQFLKNYFFKETCAILAPTRGFGFRTETWGDFP
jgi:hypothetical protein